MLLALCLKHCSQDMRWLTPSPPPWVLPSIPGKVAPHLHPHFPPSLLSRVTHPLVYYFFSPQPHCFLIHLPVLLMLCPLHESKDFCVLFTDASNGHSQTTRAGGPLYPPCWCFPGSTSPGCSLNTCHRINICSVKTC